MKTLWDTPRGLAVEITALAANLPVPVTKRLQEMGFETGKVLTCLQRGPFNGPVVVAVADSVYSLEQLIAKEIYVAPLSAQATL